jgi:hypothetical protein
LPDIGPDSPVLGRSLDGQAENRTEQSQSGQWPAPDGMIGYPWHLHLPGS